MKLHTSLLSYMNLDLNMVLHIDPLALIRALVTNTPMPEESFPINVEQHWLVLPGIRLAFMALFCLAAWRATLVEAAVLGVALIFVLTPATSYYWAILLVLPLLPGRVAPLLPILFAGFIYGHEAMTSPFVLKEDRFYSVTWCMAFFFALWLGRRASQTLWSRT